MAKILFMLYLVLISCVYGMPKTSSKITKAKDYNGPYDFLNLNFQVKLLRYGDHSIFTCAGNLIRNDWVISAGHCCEEIIKNIKSGTDTIKDYSILAGSPKISPNSDNAKEIKMKNIYIHPKYRQMTTANDIEYLVNDICMIQLQSEIPSSKNIGLVEMSPNYAANASSECYISGWGKDKTQTLPHILKYTQVHWKEPEECKVILHAHAFHSDNMICAGEKGTGACKGDSGGPLICDKKLIGIISWGVDCLKSASAFTKVTHFIPWINRILERPNKRKQADKEVESKPVVSIQHKPFKSLKNSDKEVESKPFKSLKNSFRSGKMKMPKRPPSNKNKKPKRPKNKPKLVSKKDQKGHKKIPPAKNKRPSKKSQVQENNKSREGHEVYDCIKFKNCTKPTNEPKLIGENSVGKEKVSTFSLKNNVKKSKRPQSQTKKKRPAVNSHQKDQKGQQLSPNIQKPKLPLGKNKKRKGHEVFNHLIPNKPKKKPQSNNAGKKKDQANPKSKEVQKPKDQKHHGSFHKEHFDHQPTTKKRTKYIGRINPRFNKRTCEYQCNADHSCTHKTMTPLARSIYTWHWGSCLGKYTICLHDKCCKNVRDQCGSCQDRCRDFWNKGQIGKIRDVV